ncbi:MAG: type II secretion system F family protein [Oscillospiraceae bacterium]|nr:type II secretion system F family protein [Oscillospiraceae bacterium]
MPVYHYKAITKGGQIVTNKVEDVSRLILMRKLRSNGLVPISVIQTVKRKRAVKKEKKNVTGREELLKSVNVTIAKNTKKVRKMKLMDRIRIAYLGNQKVRPKDVLIFTQNFYLLKKANFNNIHALITIIDNTENLTFKEILEDVLSGVQAGQSIYSTLEYYDNIFSTIYISMIKAGELSGALTETLFQAVNYLEESAALNKKIKGILLPNIAQFGGILIMLFGGTIFAVPMLQGVFESVGSKETLPAITLWFQSVVNSMMANWYIIFIVIGAIIGSIVYYVNTPKGRYRFHEFKYKAPIFGELIYAIDFSRFMRAVLLNVKNGTRIQESLEIGKNVVSNLALLSVIETSANNILLGESWIEPFETAGYSSSMVTEMLRIGMQTDLTVMLEKLLDYMQVDIDTIMERVTKALPQVVYAFVGAVLIFFVLVVLVPIIQVYMGTFLFSAAGV